MDHAPPSEAAAPQVSDRQPIYFLAMCLVWCGLLVWRLNADSLDCAIAAIAVALATSLVALSATETAFYRRHAFVNHYLRGDGLLSRLLSRRVFMVLWQGTKALLLALFLLVGALSFEPLQWALLLADVLLLAVLLSALSALLGGEVRKPYRGPLARHWAMRLNALCLWIAWGLLMYFSPQANYADLRWEEVIAFSAAQPAVGCDALALLARIAAVGEALALWGAQHLFAGLRQPDQVLAAWAAFLAAFGASFLIAWTYSRALVAVQARPWAVWRQPEV